MRLIHLAALGAAISLPASTAIQAQTGPWKDYGNGTVLRSNETIARGISGYTWVFVSSYSGGAGGGMASQHIMRFCNGREVAVHSESSVSMNGGDLSGNSSSVEDDLGQYEILEDRKGNTVLHMSLRKYGERFMEIRIDGAKMYTDQKLTFTRYQKVC